MKKREKEKEKNKMKHDFNIISYHINIKYFVILCKNVVWNHSREF